MSIVNIRNIWNYPFKQTNPLTGRCQANLKCHFLHKKEQKLVNVNWYMFSPQIAGWRQNCSVWTSYIIIHNLLPQRRLMSKCIQSILCVAILHSQEGNSWKGASRRWWRADRRKIWRRSRQFMICLIEIIALLSPFLLNTYLGPSVWRGILRAPDSWVPGPNCPGPNYPGPNCPGPNLPRIVRILES